MFYLFTSRWIHGVKASLTFGIKQVEAKCRVTVSQVLVKNFVQADDERPCVLSCINLSLFLDYTEMTYGVLS